MIRSRRHVWLLVALVVGGRGSLASRAAAEAPADPPPPVSAPAAWSQEFRDLLRRHDAAGGVLPESAMIRLARTTREAEHVVRFEVELARPNRIRVSYLQDGKEYGEGFNGFFAWELWQTGRRATIVSGDPETALRRAGLWLGGSRPFLEMSRLGVALEDGGTVPLGEASYRIVRGTLPGGYVRSWYLDPASGRTAKQRDLRPLHPGEKVRNIETQTGDWVRVGELTLARVEREVDLDSGEVLSESRWDEMSIVPLDGRRFDPPEILGGTVREASAAGGGGT